MRLWPKCPPLENVGRPVFRSAPRAIVQTDVESHIVAARLETAGRCEIKADRAVGRFSNVQLLEAIVRIVRTSHLPGRAKSAGPLKGSHVF